MKLTKKIYFSIVCTSTGGYIDDADIIRPFIWKFPNDFEKAVVRISIRRFHGFPHYFCSIEEDGNYLLAKNTEQEFFWKRPWDSHSVDGFIKKYFDSGELNTVKYAEMWCKKILDKNFPASQYKYLWEELDDHNEFKIPRYFKEGD